MAAYKASLSDLQSWSNETVTESYVLNEAIRQRIAIIAVLMAFTLVGNLTLILALLCKRSRRKKRVNILLLNLAFGDLAVAMFVNSTEILFLAFGDWALGPAICKIIVYVQMICLSSATNLLTAMSIDRYQVIVKPMQSLARRSRILVQISVAWTLSLLFPVPQLFIFVQYNSGLKFDGTPRRVCGSRGYTAPWQRKVYLIYTTIYTLIVPAIIMLYCYVNIIHVVWIRARNEATQPSCSNQPCRRRPASPSLQSYSRSSKNGGINDCDNTACPCRGEEQVSPRTNRKNKLTRNKRSTDTPNFSNKTYRRHKNEDSNPGSPRMSARRGLISASKRRVLIMTLTVVVSFLVCHTPYFCVTLVRIYSDYQVKLELAMVISEFMVMINSSLNPLLYGLFALRDYHIKRVVTSLPCSRSSPFHRDRGSSKCLNENHELLTSVRCRLVSFSGKGRTKTVLAPKSYRSNLHINLLSHQTQPERVLPSEIISSSKSLTSPPSKALPGSRSIPCFERKIKKLHQFSSDTVIVTNMDAVYSSLGIGERSREQEEA